MAALLTRSPARVWRLAVREPHGVPDRNRHRERVLEELSRHGLELLTVEYQRRQLARLYVAAAHRIPWSMAEAAVSEVPGYVAETLEGGRS
jgi:hypothetical protein